MDVSSVLNMSTISTVPLFKTDIVMAVVEGRGRAHSEIGLAYIDLSSPKLHLAQFRDNARFDSLKMKCHVCSPIEVIFPDTLYNNNNIIVAIIAESFPSIALKSLERRFFNEQAGYETITKLSYQNYSWIDIELQSKYYSLSAAAALLQYIRMAKNIQYTPKTLKVLFESSLDTMIIDPSSARFLELLINLSNPKSKQNLFSAINRTKTKTGYVMLRSNILQPSTNDKLLNERFDMLSLMFSKIETFDAIDEVLQSYSLVDLDQLLVNLVQSSFTNSGRKNVRNAEKKIEIILQLKHVVSFVPQLREILRTLDHPKFVDYASKLTDQKFEIILEKIDRVIHSETKLTKGASMKMEKCFAIKFKECALLDSARSVYSDTIDDIIALVNAYQVKFKLDGIKISTSNTHGYFMQMKFESAQAPKLPESFSTIKVKGNMISFTSRDLNKLNTRIASSVEEIYIQSEKIAIRLIHDVLNEISCFYNLVDIIAHVDILFSFAQLACEGSYVRPSFNNFTCIKEGKHPILHDEQTAISNSISMSEDTNFFVITGPNMSGKTTFLKQTALLQIMAQIGSFVPAESATFRICDKLFTRMNLNDNLQINSSSFEMETKELHYIINTLTEKSLILVDELGRENINEKTVPFCWSIAEALLNTKAFTLFSTHFQEIAMIPIIFLNAENYHFCREVQNENGQISKYPHLLREGPNKELSYGIILADESGMNTKLIDEAFNISQQLSLNNLNSSTNVLMSTDSVNEESIIRRAKYRMVSALLRDFADPMQSLDLDLIRQHQSSFEIATEQTPINTHQEEFLETSDSPNPDLLVNPSE